MNRIRELRQSLNLSLRKLQEYTGIDFSRLAVIEKNNCNIEEKTIRKLCSFFNVSSSYLLGNDGFIFFYDSIKERNFPLVYEQFKKTLTPDTYSVVIENNAVKRILNLEGYSRLDEADRVRNAAFHRVITTNRYKSFLEELNDNEFQNEAEEITSFIEIEKYRRNL